MGKLSKKPVPYFPGASGEETDEAGVLLANAESQQAWHSIHQSEATTSGQGPQVYQRRRKQALLHAERSREGLREDIQLANGPDAGTRVDRPSWIYRALCGRRQSTVLERPVLASSEEISESESEEESDCAPVTPDVVERPQSRKSLYKPIPSLPLDFVQEQRAKFSNIEAFMLEEESPQPDADQRSPQFVSEHDDDELDVGRVEYVQARAWQALEAVAEEEVIEIVDEEETEERGAEAESLTKRGRIEAFARDMRTAEAGVSREVVLSSDAETRLERVDEESGRGLPAEEVQQRSHAWDGLDGEPTSELDRSAAPETMPCTKDAESVRVETVGDVRQGKKRTDESVRRLVFDEIPANVPRGRRTSPTELSQARGKEKAHQVETDNADITNEGADVSQGADIAKALRKLSLTGAVGALEKSADGASEGGFAGVDVSRRVSRRRSSLAKPWKVAKEPETPLQAILQACGQATMPSLNDFISKFYPVEKLVKLGEGTFGEAFRAGDMCFKIVPMGSNVMVNGDAQKTVAEMYSEVLLTNAITSIRFGQKEGALPDNASDNFIQTYGVGICSGAYSDELTAAWEGWDRENTSENDHPRIFQNDQEYVVFAFADGGSDLEHFVLRSYVEAVSLLLQVAAALAAAEQGCKFEHRDLHWGNILLARRGQEEVRLRLNGQTLRMRAHGISVALIDFTLSRLDTDARVLFCDLTPDTWLFEGPKGDVQADTYRRMKKATSGCWEGSYPATNVFWIHYLADILLNKKAFTCSPKEKHALRGFRKRSLSYTCAGDILQDTLFDEYWCK